MKQQRGQGQSKASHFSKLEYVKGLSKFIPSLVIQKIIERSNTTEKQKLPELQSMETVVIFADISGFTNLSEACAKRGIQGNEDLAFCINRYMEGMVKFLDQYGGDIIKFVGDAMIVMWPPIDPESTNYETSRAQAIRRAIQCSQDIQKRMNNLQILPGVSLSVKIGIGYGQCGILYVGGVFNRAETMTVGEALVQALQSESMATGGGQVVVSQTCFQHVAEYFQSTQLFYPETEEVFNLIDLKYLGNRVKIQSDIMKMTSQITTDSLQKVKKQLKGNVPHCIIPFLKIEQEIFASEIRSLTVMFISLGIDLSSAGTTEGIGQIQAIVTEVQKQVYRLQGSINKLVMDDKGSTMICIWGLLPFAHEDDAQRALLTGFNIIKALMKLNVYCNIGVSSGECFSGVTGAQGSRKEFSVLGDIVNLAARIMGSMKAKNCKNVIKCDLNTRMLAGDTFDFMYQQPHNELKGKSISIPFFKPQDPADKFFMASQKVLQPQLFLMDHQNPMNLQRSTSFEAHTQTIGFETTMGDIITDIIKYYTSDETNQPFLSVIKGMAGSGKTVFMKHLFTEMKKVSKFAPYLEQNKDKLPIFTSNTNAETSLYFLNIWRPIIQMMVKFYCKRQNLKCEHFIAECIIKSGNEDKVDLICELTGIDKLKMGSKNLANLWQDQIKTKDQMFPFVKMPDYQLDHKDQLIEFLTNLFKTLIGEGDQISEWGSVSSDSEAAQSKKSKKSTDSENEKAKPPIILCLDGAHRMCPTSWELLDSITRECEQVAIFLIIKSDEKDRLMILPESVYTFEKIWTQITNELNVRMVDIPILSVDQIGQLIVANGQTYKSTYLQEVQDMTKIVDPQCTIKTVEGSEQWNVTLTEKWQLKYIIKSIEESITSVIAKNCKSNPLLCLQYFVNLLQNGFVIVQPDGYVKPQHKFNACRKIDDWTPVPVPRMVMKSSMQSVSQFFFSIQSKQGNKKKPGELQAATIAVVLLNVSSILGREFSLEALKFISPLKMSGNNSSRIEDAIRLLEARDFLEIVDVDERKSQQLRFNKPLLRESLYQMLRYKACKKGLHQDVVKFIQMEPNMFSGKDASIKTEMLLSHMLLAQDCDEEKQLMRDSRTALVVLRIQNKLHKNPNGIVFDETLKKGRNEKNLLSTEYGAFSKKVSMRHIQLTQFDLTWYQNEDEIQNGHFHGRIKLPFIYEIEKQNFGGGLPGFRMGVSMWINEKKKESGKRILIFACETTYDRDRWIAAIDYLKTKAIYEAYSKNNKLVSFMGQDNDLDTKEQEDDANVDLRGLLYDFGDNFKRQTMGVSSFAASNTMNNAKNGARNTFQASSRAESILRRQSQLNQRFNFQSKQPTKAINLVNKLKLLYEVGMTTYLHHLHHSRLQEANVVGISHSQKQEVEENMQFPQIEWNIRSMIKQDIQDDEQRFKDERSMSTDSGSVVRDSQIGFFGRGQDSIQRQSTSQKVQQLQGKLAAKGKSSPMNGDQKIGELKKEDLVNQQLNHVSEVFQKMGKGAIQGVNLSGLMQSHTVPPSTTESIFKETGQKDLQKRLTQKNSKRRSSSLSAEQIKNKLRFEPNGQIEEIDQEESSSNSRRVKIENDFSSHKYTTNSQSSSKKSKSQKNSNKNVKIKIKKPSFNLIVPTQNRLLQKYNSPQNQPEQIQRIQSDCISSRSKLSKRSSNSRSKHSNLQHASTLRIPRNNLSVPQIQNRHRAAKMKRTSGSDNDSNQQNAILQLLLKQNEKIEELVRQQNEFREQMSQHSMVIQQNTSSLSVIPRQSLEAGELAISQQQNSNSLLVPPQERQQSSSSDNDREQHGRRRQSIAISYASNNQHESEQRGSQSNEEEKDSDNIGGQPDHQGHHSISEKVLAPIPELKLNEAAKVDQEPPKKTSGRGVLRGHYPTGFDQMIPKVPEHKKILTKIQAEYVEPEELKARQQDSQWTQRTNSMLSAVGNGEMQVIQPSQLSDNSAGGLFSDEEHYSDGSVGRQVDNHPSKKNQAIYMSDIKGSTGQSINSIKSITNPVNPTTQAHNHKQYSAMYLLSDEGKAEESKTKHDNQKKRKTLENVDKLSLSLSAILSKNKYSQDSRAHAVDASSQGGKNSKSSLKLKKFISVENL